MNDDLVQRLLDFTCKGKCSHASCRMEREAAQEIKRLRKLLAKKEKK